MNFPYSIRILINSASTAKALEINEIVAYLETLGVPREGHKVTLAWNTKADMDFYVQNLNAPEEVTSWMNEDDEDDYAAKLQIDQTGGTEDMHVENIKLPEDKGNYAIFVNCFHSDGDFGRIPEIPFTVVTQIDGKYRRFSKAWNFEMMGEDNDAENMAGMMKIGTITW